MLFVLIVLAHHRRRILDVNITAHPTAEWSAQQVVEAFPDDPAPRWLHRDREPIYGAVFQRRVAGMGIAEVVAAPASPWQNPCVERVIGSIRRECLDHVIVLNEAHLRCVLTSYGWYYHRSRTHLAPDKDTPDHRRALSHPSDPSSRFLKSVVSTTATNDARRKRPVHRPCTSAPGQTAHSSRHCLASSTQTCRVGVIDQRDVKNVQGPDLHSADRIGGPDSARSTPTGFGERQA